MKILIVDDEKHVITAISHLIPAKRLGITEVLSARTSAEAKTILEKENPEIAIVDMILQDQTGMSLLAFILNKRLPTKLIAISGHGDYEYVRTMLLNGAVDYLLKPIEMEPLIESIQKAIRSYNEDRKSKPEPLAPVMSNSFSAQYIRTLLRKMLIPNQQKGVYEELSVHNDQFSGQQRCTLLYYDLNYLPTRSSIFLTHLNMFEEKVKSYFSLHRCGYFLDKFSSDHEKLILIFGGAEHTLQQMERMAASSFADTVHSFHMGSKCEITFPNDFKDGFEHAQEAFFTNDSLVLPEILQQYATPIRKKKPNFPPELERKLLSAILIQDLAGLNEVTESWLQTALFGESLPLSVVRDITDHYNSMYARWTSRLKILFPEFSVNPAQSYLVYEDYLNEYFAFSCPMMQASILRSLYLLMAQVGKISPTVDIFQQISCYMDLNYDQSFNQAEYAQFFHLNKDYLSRKFKQVFGEGMISYLNRLRITHAEELMRDPDLKIRDIAYRTGFTDDKYFTRQFKTIMRLTPSEYRALHCQTGVADPTLRPED